MFGNGNEYGADVIKSILAIAILVSLSYSMFYPPKATEYSKIYGSHNNYEKAAPVTMNRSSKDTGPMEKQAVTIRLIDMPVDFTGDNVPDIGYIKGWEETGYKFDVLLERIDPYSYKRTPLLNCNVTLRITLWDDKGGRYINSTTRKTNCLGRVIFNFTGFYSNEGNRINEQGLSASGAAVIEYAGSSRYSNSTKEVLLNYMAKPAPPNRFDGPHDNTCFLNTCFFPFMLILPIVFISIYFRNREQEKRIIVEKMFEIIKRDTDQTNLDPTLFRLVEGLKMAKQINHRTCEARYLRQMGLVYRDKKEPDMAITYIEYAMEIEKELGLEDREIFDLIRIAHLYLDLGNNDEAVEYQRRATEVYGKWFPN